MPARPLRVMVVLPYDMSARNFIGSQVACLLASRKELEVRIISRDSKDRDQLASLPRPLSWRPMLRPFRDYQVGWKLRLDGWRRAFADSRFTLGLLLHLTLVFRFNTIAGFRGFQDRLKQSRGMRSLAFREGLPSFRWLGFPFPSSLRLFRLLYRFYLSFWQRHIVAERQVDEFSPDMMVLAHLQTGVITPYLLAAHARSIPVLGINGSWDQPTTKGPLATGVIRILAQSRRVADELTQYHAYPSDRIEIVGWPQMDVYGATQRTPRQAFLKALGLEGRRYMLLGAYSDRLGSHEPAMCAHIAQQIAAGTYGPNCTLYIRCHPLDRTWRDRLLPLHNPPEVIVEPPQLGRLDYLADLLYHAEAVIASAGTISLDAVALDTPAIAVAFEDLSLPFYDRPVRRYDMEHYAAVIATDGIRLARTLDELQSAIQGYMDDRSLDAANRRTLRQAHLDPLDAGASHRIVEAIARVAQEVGPR